MKLFQLDEADDKYAVIWEPQTLMLQPFAKIFKRDRSKSKDKANKELAFVYFYCDIKSDYNIHVDLEIRMKSIKADLGLDKAWKIDKIMEEAIGFYESMSTSITANILRDGMYIANKLSGKMKEKVDDDDIDIQDIKNLLDSINKIPGVIKSLQDAEKAVLKEIQENQGKLGSKEKALFEDNL